MLEPFDLTIIGGGPIGLYANQYALKKQIKSQIIEKLPILGGQLMNLYPENPIYDVAGLEKWTARKLINGIIAQTKKYEPVYCLNESVTEVKRENLIYKIKTNKCVHESKSVLITSGPSVSIPKKWATMSCSELAEVGLLSELGDSSKTLGKCIVVVGGSEETVGWALEAARYARRVLIVNWRFMDSFGVLQASVTAPRNVDILEPYEILELIGNHRLSQIKVCHARTGSELSIDVDYLIMARGHLSDLNVVRSWGLEVQGNGLKVDEFMHTSQPGIFAAGDIVHYEGKQKLIKTGVHEAAIAVQSTENYLQAIWGRPLI